MSPEFEMVGTSRDAGLQANYDFLQSDDPLMQSVLNSTMIDSISLDGSYLANMPAMTHESGMSYEERNSLDPEAYHFTAEIRKGGDNFNQLYSKFIGVHAVDAAEYYVDQHIKSDNPLWSIPAGLALLATPENAGKTGLVLGGAGIASAFMTAYRAAGVLGVAEEGALITAETASGMPLVRRWDFDTPSQYTHSAPISGNPLEPGFVGPVNSATGQAERYLFRGDNRSPEVIFKEGFQPLGNNTDLHLYASENVPSIYVSTSRSPNVARDFASDEGVVFTIRGQTQGVDVNGVLGTRSPFPDELEIAVPGGIKPGDILGGRAVDPSTGKFTGPFINNPNFKK